MEQEIAKIKQGLGTGSINIFGAPMSGKDTVGKSLAKMLGAKFLSSGEIIREFEAKSKENMTTGGELIKTDQFYEIVLPYFRRSELSGKGLILSSVGRWNGEEVAVLAEAKKSGHPIRLVLFLDLAEEEIIKRWEVAKETADRGERADDRNLEILKIRLQEFKQKTLPVLEKYKKLGLLLPIQVSGDREEVLKLVVTEISRVLASR